MDTMSAAVAALASALLVFVLGIACEWWRNERERRGLLRRLLAEIEHNAELLSMVACRRGEQRCCRPVIQRTARLGIRAALLCPSQGDFGEPMF